MLARRSGEIEREINRAVDAITKGAPPEPLIPRMHELEAERTSVKAAIKAAEEADNVIALPPKALDRYQRDVSELAEELKRGTPGDNAALFARIRTLVTAIVVHASPSTAGGAGTNAAAADDRRVRIDIKGRLAELCDNPALFPNVSTSGVERW